MKKYSLLLTLICVLFLGIQSASAQDRLEEMAKDKTTALAKSLDLSPAQVKKVFEIYYTAYEKNEGVLSEELIQNMRKKINAVLEPGQSEKFKNAILIEQTRKEKIESANRG